MNDKRKQSMYMPQGMIEELEIEAERQSRSKSWLVQQAWKIAKEKVHALHPDNPSEN